MKTKQLPKPRAGKRVLLVLSILLIVSGMIRLGAGTGAAIALELGDVSSDETALQALEPDADISPELVQLLKDVKQREEKLKEREDAVEARMQVLALIEAEVEKDLDQLEQAESNLRATISSANQAAETDIQRLTAVYENMKSEQAAVLFSRMEPSFAAGFLGRMRPDSAAQILAGLEPDLAYSISVVLAGRNADVPTETLPQ
jgi:flagellar motility protein MotE (MotC chaperone)